MVQAVPVVGAGLDQMRYGPSVEEAFAGCGIGVEQCAGLDEVYLFGVGQGQQA